MARITEKQAQQMNSNVSNWFQLKDDGDVARVQFLCDTVEDVPIYSVHRVKISVNNGKTIEVSVDCVRNGPADDINACPFCREGMPVKPARFVTMYQHDDGKVKVWERGKQFMNKVQQLMNRYHPLSSKVFEIERSGKAGDKQTTYDVFPVDNVEAIDVSTLEEVGIEGSAVLIKSVADMETYLQTGEFPDDYEQAPQAEPVRRRVPTTTSQVNTSDKASSSRRSASVDTGSEVPRRSTPRSKEVF